MLFLSICDSADLKNDCSVFAIIECYAWAADFVEPRVKMVSKQQEYNYSRSMHTLPDFAPVQIGMNFLDARSRKPVWLSRTRSLSIAMPPTVIRRSLLGFNCLLRPSRHATSSNSIEFRRGEATYRRHIKKLSIPPAPSFGPQKPTRRRLDESIPASSHIIFNPPPTAPNVYHTPLKFMPKSDRRRQLYTDRGTPSLYNIGNNGTTKSQPEQPSPIAKPGTALHEIARSLPSSLLPQVPEGDRMPPALKRIQEKKYHVTPEQVAEMQRLRNEDPSRWTIDRLAAEYECSTHFVRICAKNETAGKAHGERLVLTQNRWGRKKTLARQDRRRRKDLWGRDA